MIAVKLGDNGLVLDEGAFAYCAALLQVTGFENVAEVGDYSFAYTAVVFADLSGATRIGDGAFLKEAMTPFTVVLGDKLTDIGENPFAMCKLTAFESSYTEEFNGQQFNVITNTFDINESIKIIDGMLYRVVPNGLELIAYTGDSTAVTVADGTVRITAQAFAGSKVVQVMLPSTLVSIGHKAFYGCDELTMVYFASYEAPILEEEYDYNYWVSAENLPATGEYQYQDAYTGEILYYDGLGIIPYFMWNATEAPSVIYYGANFANYVGRVENTMIMVKPANGQHYDSFIYGQYFVSTVEGAAAADKVTLDAIAAIDSLPDNITLEHKDLVLAARAAYAKISSKTLQDLVYNYSKLTKAEEKIKNLEFIRDDQNPSDPEPSDPENPGNEQTAEESVSGKTVVIIILSVLLGMFVASTAVFLILFILLKKKPSKEAPEAEEKDETETAEETEDEEKTEEITEEETAEVETETNDNDVQGETDEKKND